MSELRKEPGSEWQDWEQELAEWHARRGGDCIPRDSGMLPRQRCRYCVEPCDCGGSERWEYVNNEHPTRGAVFYEEPPGYKVRNLSDAMSVTRSSRSVLDVVERREREDRDRPRRLLGRDERWEPFFPAPPSTSDLGMVE